jgi:hypothetical protein
MLTTYALSRLLPGMKTKFVFLLEVVVGSAVLLLLQSTIKTIYVQCYS